MFTNILVVKLLVFMLLLLAIEGKNIATGAKNMNAELLQTIDSYMDYSQNPCENFYEYACGSWEQIHTETQNYVDTIGSLEYRANIEMAEILEQRIKAGKQETNAVYRKVRDYYETCKEQTEFTMETYLKIVKPTENDELDWPNWLGENAYTWKDKNWNWLELLGKLNSYGLNNVLLKEELQNRNASDFIIQLNKAEETSEEPNMAREELDLLQQLTDSPFITDRIRAHKLEVFKTALQQLQQRYNDESLVHEITLSELERHTNGMQFKAYFQALIADDAIVTDDMPLLVHNIAYMRKLNDLIRKTTNETLGYFMLLKFLAYLKIQTPKIAVSPQHCIENMRAHMSLALDYMYARENYQYIKRDSDAAILKVFHTMQLKFSEIIAEHSAEFTAEELEFLHAKIKHMQLNIGNLPQRVSERYYQQYYADLEVERNYFYWNNLNTMRHAVRRSHQLLKQHTPAPEHTFINWKYASPAYDQATNILIIPFSYLKMPIFHRHFHELFHFAELGNSLGHEIIHGFDMNGLKYDALGNPSTLFLDAVHEKRHFLHALECLSRVRTSNMNEKIADFSGFRLAYESYFNYTHHQQQASFELGHALSDRKLFFIKFAQFFCAINPDRIKYDETHDTPFERVPQVVANHAEFAREFGCRPYTRMHPQRKCHLW